MAGQEESYEANYNEGYAEAREAGYEAGLKDGYDNGHGDGYDEGYYAGYDNGAAIAYDECYDDGVTDTHGMRDGEQETQQENLIQQSCRPPMCPICQYDLGTNGVPEALPCTHVYCSGCIAQWLRNNTTCPDCRRDVNEPPVDTHIVQGHGQGANSRRRRRGGRRRRHRSCRIGQRVGRLCSNAVCGSSF